MGHFFTKHLIIIFNKKNTKDSEGYEIAFHTGSNNISCIQIIPNKVESIEYYENKFKLRIKDPAFLDMHKPLYSFHFGQVSIRSLVSCQLSETKSFNNKMLCALKQSQSIKYDIGIESNLKSEETPPDLKADVCDEYKSLNHQTCIQKYRPKMNKNSNDTYYIVIQPYSQDFDNSIGTVNINPTDHEIKLEKHIELRSDQKFDNGLIFKVIEHNSDDFSLLSVLDRPSKQNNCSGNLEDKFCECQGECRQCLGSEKVIRDYFQYVVVEATGTSEQCRTLEQYKLYNFFSKFDKDTKF